MKTKVISVFLSALVLFASCSSSTMIQTNPNGAKIYMNGEFIGTTPHQHRDMKISTATNNLVLKKEGYETLRTSFSKDEEVNIGAVIGGLFFWFPFLWTMGYKSTHNYEMVPVSGSDNKQEVRTNETKETSSKAERLKELKQLLEDNLITESDYEKKKEVILSE